MNKQEISINRNQLERAAVEEGLSPEKAEAIWTRLFEQSSAKTHFEVAQVGYFFGALLVIGAMGWFMANGWDSFRGWQIFAIASGYAVVFVLVGRYLWAKPMFHIPGGLLVTVAVCMVPLAVYGLEREFHLWPAFDPGSYGNFHPYINASWVAMEVATIFAAVITLRYFRFPFLTAPAAYALWYMSMDATELIFGRQWTWSEECKVSAIFGLIMLLVSYLIDRKTELDFAFWGYLFGLLTFTGGLSLVDSGNQWAKFVYCLIHLAMIAASLALQRKVFLVFGAMGVFFYLANEAHTYFRNSMAFPFVLSFIGIAIIIAAMKFKKNEAILQQRISSWFPGRATPI